MHVGCLLLHLAAEDVLSQTSRVKTRGLAGSNSATMKWKNTFSGHEEWRRTKCTATMEPRRLTKRTTCPVSVLRRLGVVEECVVVCGIQERADSEAEQWLEEEAENEGGNDDALAKENHLEEWVDSKIGSWRKETKGVLLLLGARRKRMTFSLEPGWRKGKFQSEKERELEFRE